MTESSGSEYDPRIYYALSGTDAAHFSIDGGTEGTSSGTGQLKTKGALDAAMKNQYTVTITAWSNNYNEENGVWTEQLVDDPLIPAKEYEATITVTIDVNSPPSFKETSPTRTVQDTTAIGGNVGSPLTATDPEGDTITYALNRSADPTLPDLTDVFDINTNTGQITTKVALSSLTILTYSGRVSASDDSGTLIRSLIDVTITINKPPVFSDGNTTTRSIAENVPAGTNIGSAVAATDQNTGDTLTYSLGGTDAASFSIDTTTGQLQTAASLDYETKSTYSVTVDVSDGNSRSDSITVTITITDVDETVTTPPVQQNNPPQFSEGTITKRTVFENAPTGTDIGNPVAATDADTGNTLTYSLSGTDAASFSIVSTTGQLRTAAALDYETQTIYTVTVNVFDGNGGQDSITVTINVTDVNDTGTPPPVQQNNPPHFSEGALTTRTVFENTPAGTDIGNPVAATDADTGDTLTYSLSGTDAASFSIVSITGQLRTAAALDYETQSTYRVTVNVFDGNGGQNSIVVTIYVSEPGTSTTPTTTPSVDGQIGFSELMIPSKFGVRSFPQWIELYNNSLTDSVDLSGWKLSIEARDLNGDHRYGEVTLQSVPIPANGTAIIVTWTGRESVTLPANRIYNFFNNHAGDFEQNEHRNMVIGEAGFFLKLEDTHGNVIDIAGNLDGDTLTNDIPKWNLPKLTIGNNIRVSLIRRYEPEEISPLDGTNSKNWVPSSDVNLSVFGFWGNPSDVGNPGHRSRHPLPVELSYFNAELSDAGVQIQWTTESELDNAGFNIYRSTTKNGHFVKVNPNLIKGAGSTGEQNDYSWIDETAKPGVEYYYRIEDISFSGVKQPLATKRLNGIHTAKNRALTSWGVIKQR